MFHEKISHYILEKNRKSSMTQIKSWDLFQFIHWIKTYLVSMRKME